MAPNGVSISRSQYDRFHIARDVKGVLPDDLKDKGLEALRNNDLDEVVKILGVGAERVRGKQREDLLRVRNNFVSNWDYILDYRLRLQALGYDCSEFMGLGSMESNVGKFKNRVRARAWSRKGKYAVGNVLSRAIQGSLGAYTSQVVTRLDEELKEMVRAGASVVKKAVLGEYPGVKSGHFPCLDHGTEGYATMFRHLLEEGYAN